jgi:hypothetical protein
MRGMNIRMGTGMCTGSDSVTGSGLGTGTGTRTYLLIAQGAAVQSKESEVSGGKNCAEYKGGACSQEIGCMSAAWVCLSVCHRIVWVDTLFASLALSFLLSSHRFNFSDFIGIRLAEEHEAFARYR